MRKPQTGQQPLGGANNRYELWAPNSQWVRGLQQIHPEKKSDETVKKRTPKENHKYHPSALKHLEAKRVIGIAAALGLNPLPKDVDPFHGCAALDGLVTCGEITKSIRHLSVSGGNPYSAVRLIPLKQMELGELVL